MAVVVGEAAVRLRPETSRFGDEAERDIDDKMPGVAKKAAGFFIAAFAAVGVGAFLGNAISQASDLSESASKVGVVFGDAAGKVNEFASTASTSLGLSEAAALGATGTFGNLLRSTGLANDAAADMSIGMVGLAGDLASFNNASPEEALEALRSGLLGEAEPLKQFGVNLNAAAIEAKAAELGLVGVNGELTDAQKAQAAYAVIMEQTALSQGDFARTSAGLANQQRIVRAQFQDLSADIGGLFVPMLGNAAVAVTGGLMPKLLELTAGLPDLGNALGSIGDYVRVGFGVDPVNELYVATGGVAGSLQFVAQTAGELAAIFGEVFADGKAGADLLAEHSLAGLTANIGQVAHGVMETLGPAFLSIQQAVAPALEQIGGAFGDAFGGAESGGGVFGVLISAVQLIGPLIGDYIARWLPVIEAVIPIIADILSGLAPVIADIVAQIGPVLASLMPIISQVAGLFAGTLATVFTALAPVIPVLVDAIGQVASVLAGAFLTVLETLAPVLPVLVEAIGQIAGVLAGAFAGALGAIAPVLPVIANVIGLVAGMLADTLAAALQALLPILPPLVEALATIAQTLIGALMGALEAVLPIIPMLVDVLLTLIEAAVIPLLPLLPILADLISMILAAVAPLIPPILQLAMLIIQLAVAAIVPLLPLLPIIIGLFTGVINILMPIISVVIGVIGAFIGMASTVATVVIGFVSGIIGVFTGLWTGITSVVSRIVGGVTTTFGGLRDGVVGIFTGIADTVGGLFEGIGAAVKTALNVVIRGINGSVISGINLVIDGVNFVNPFDDIPHVPKIPTLHMGGVFDSGSLAGEGLALLRDDELVATPEQRVIADNLLRSLLDGDLPAPTAATGTAAVGASVTNYITQQPGESGASLAARVTQGVVWNLNAGITRPVGAGAEA